MVILVATLGMMSSSVRADTFLWNGSGVSGGVENVYLDNPVATLTWNNGAPTATVPTLTDTASIVLTTTASLSQTAPLTIGTFAVGNLAGGTINLTNFNTFTNFILNGPDNVVVGGGITTITNSFTISGGGSLLVSGGQVRLPVSASNAGLIVVTGGTLTGSFAETGGAPLPSGLVSIWQFEGNALDTSGNGRDGSPTNIVYSGDAKFGTGAASFNSSSPSYIYTPNVKPAFTSPATNSFTLELWIKPTAGGIVVDERGQVGGGWQDSQIEVLSSGQVRVRVWNLSSVVLGNVVFNDWNHVAIRYNAASGGRLDGFLNGIQSGSVSGNRQVPTNQYWALGHNDSTNLGHGGYFNGLMDEFAIYNRVLTSDEIIDRFNFSPTGNFFTNLAGSEIQVTGGALDVTKSVFYNLGSIAVSGSGRAFFGGVGTQTGFISVENGGIVTGTGSWVNNGTVKLLDGTVEGTSLFTNNKTLTGTGIITAPFSNVTGATVYLDGGSLQLTSATAPTNTGTIQIGSNQLVVAAASWTNAGSLIISGGSVRTGGGTGLLTNAGFISAGSSIDSNLVNTGTLVLTNHTSVTGNFTNGSTGRVLPSGYNLAALGGAPITNDGTFILNAATLSVPGVNQFLNRSTGVIDLENGSVLDLPGVSPAFIFTNSGLIQLLGAGSSITGKGATFSPSSTSRLRVFDGAVLDLSSAGSMVFTQTTNGAGSLEPRGGRIIIDGSITNQGAGGAFINPNNLIGHGTVEIRSGTYSGLNNAFRWLAANGGTLTVENAPGVTIRDLVLGTNLIGNSSNTTVFTNSFTFNSTSASNPAHIQLANQTLVVRDGGSGPGTITTSTGPNAIFDLNNDANENGTIVAAVANAGYLRVANFGSNVAYTITSGLVNLTSGSVAYASGGPSFTLKSDVTNYGTFHDARGAIEGDIRNVGTWNEGVGGVLTYNGAFTNEGYVNKTGANSMQLITANAASPFVNAGTVVVSAGTLSIGNPGGSGLVLVYHMNNDFTDASSKGLDGTGANGVTFNTTIPKLGSAAGSFDGINDYIVTPNVAPSFPAENISIGVWFNPTPGTGGIIVTEVGAPSPNPGTHHDSFLEVLSSGQVRARVWNLPFVNLGNANMGTWNYAVLRYDKSTLQLDGFLNGAFSSVSTGDRLSSKEAAGAEFYGLGMTDSQNLGDGTYFNGFLDEFALFNRAISNTEILTYYNSGAGAEISEDLVRSFGLSTFTNETGGRLNANGGILDVSGVTFVNKGTIAVASGASAILGIVSDQGGTITVASGGSLVGDNNWNNNGFVSLDSSAIKMNSAMTNSGLLLKTGSGAASISGGEAFTANLGTVRITGGTLVVNPVAANSAPILLWHLNNDYLDASGNGNTGVPSGGTGFDTVNPKLGSAAGSFNDVNGYIRTPNLTSHFGGVETYSLQLWFLATNAGVIVNENGFADITSGFRDSHIEILPSGQVRMGAYNGSSPQFVTAGTVPFGEWQHLVLRYDKANLRLDGFLNGAFVGSTIFNRLAPFEAGAQQYWSLAASTHGGANLGDATYFGGLIDEFAVFNRALSDAEIALIYNSGAGTEITTELLQSILPRASFTNHAAGKIEVVGGVTDLTQGPFHNFGAVSLSANSVAVIGTFSTQTGTITASDSILSVQQNWTNNGYVAITHSEIRTGNGAGLFTNANYISTGSSINSDFVNAGTFTLTDNTSITGNFTNAGWTNLAGNDLTVNGSINANTGDGITTGVLTGSGTYTMSPTNGEATFTNDITSATADGGNYDTRSVTFNMASGTINFEVLSTDSGSGAFSQLANGYAMGTLTLPNTLTLLRLLDDTINQGGGTQEAIYVENLHLGTALTASNFDFGGSSLKIYYNHIVGDDDGDFVGTLDGAERVVYFGNIIPMNPAAPPSGVVPEPSTFALLLLGIPLLWWVWRRKLGKTAVRG